MYWLSLAEDYYICQIPGCNATINKVWNNIHQVSSSSNWLKICVLRVKDMFHWNILKSRDMWLSQLICWCKIREQGDQVQEEQGEEKGEVKLEPKPLPIFSSGRQRYGDTRDVPFYPKNLSSTRRKVTYLHATIHPFNTTDTWLMILVAIKGHSSRKKWLTTLQSSYTIRMMARALICTCSELRICGRQVQELHRRISKINVIAMAQSFMMYQ